MSRFTKEHRQRFWSRVQKGKKRECWEWLWGCTKAGYGQLQIRAVSKQPLLAHRVAWELTNGPIPSGLHVLHECDNPICCNPDHLFLGTQQDNNKDRDAKGRVASGDNNGARTKPHRNPFIRNRGSGLKGEDHPMARLRQKDIDKMRKEFDAGMTKAELARKYGISQTHAGRIITRKVWK